MNIIEKVLKGIKGGADASHLTELVTIGADTFFGIAVAEQFELPVVEARQCAARYAKVALSVGRIAESGDQAAWRNCAADLMQDAKGNFVRR